LMVIFLAAVP